MYLHTNFNCLPQSNLNNPQVRTFSHNESTLVTSLVADRHLFNDAEEDLETSLIDSENEIPETWALDSIDASVVDSYDVTVLDSDRWCFSTAQFSNPVTQQLYTALRKSDNCELEAIVKSISSLDLQEALKDQEDTKKINLIGLAAYFNNSEAINILIHSIDELILRELLLQKDVHGWTAFHHLALMKDKGIWYRNLKKRVHVKTNEISTFYCESPSMLRKYVKSKTKKFSSKNNPDFRVYFREGNLEIRKEHHLSFDRFNQNYGEKFSMRPRHFKIIPHVKADVFKFFWLNSSLYRKVDKESLAKIDQHLKEVYVHGEERGVAISEVRYDEEGKAIPDNIQLGLGCEARRDFSPGEVVTIYGGEYNYTGSDKRSQYYELLEKDRVSDPMYGHASNYSTLFFHRGIHFRSYGAMCLHSTTNAEHREVENMLFVPFLITQATERIKEGQQICVDYGRGYFQSRGITPYDIRPNAAKTH